MFVNKSGANGFWYCLGYCHLVPSLLGGARRHPEIAFNSVSCKCRCFNCHTPDRYKQTNKQKNLSESLPAEEIVIDLVETGKFFRG
jgi:hypothetical protein